MAKSNRRAAARDRDRRWSRAACADGWDQLQEIAREIWGAGVKVYGEGRSSGWAVVEGIDQDWRGWDAIAVSRWGRFARAARAVADDTAYQYYSLIYLNVFCDEDGRPRAVPAVWEGDQA